MIRFWAIFVKVSPPAGRSLWLPTSSRCQGVFTQMIQGVMLNEGGSVDDLVKQAGVDLAAVK